MTDRSSNSILGTGATGQINSDSIAPEKAFTHKYLQRCFENEKRIA